jgi:hypothetical protein
MAVRVKPTIVAVAPTSTSLFEPLTVGAVSALSVQVENLSLTQTFNGTVRSRLDPGNDMSPSTLPDFVGIGPGQSAVATVSLPATSEFDVVGTMDGAGDNVRVTVVSRMDATLLGSGRTR